MPSFSMTSFLFGAKKMHPDSISQSPKMSRIQLLLIITFAVVINCIFSFALLLLFSLCHSLALVSHVCTQTLACETQYLSTK